MSVLRSVSIVLATAFAQVAAAADFDGSMPMTCTALQAHDCLPTANACTRIKPESDIEPIFGIDFAKKEVRSPYRTNLLTISSARTNSDSLVMQGGDLLAAWSAMVDKKTGALTISIADSKGAYVAFGQCKIAQKK
jgi:hypothetical protein